ncbi:MAG: N-acetylneuraminate synthase family protein [Polyangiaceae bacterium]|nr:N-acetylneuraminate synthase family protein [Polyangiaceae bacterium]
MPNEFSICGRKVGPEHPPLVIAEIGINHEGSLEVAKQMVDAALGAGAEVIKHQTHVVEDEMSDEAKKVIPGNADVSIYEIMDRCALNERDETALKEYIESKGAIFISTPFSRAAAHRLERMNAGAYKIGSGECNNYPLIDLVASFGKPMIVSTGMNSIESVAKSVKIMEKHGVPYCLFHCTNIYPTPPNLVRLGAMTELQEAFPNAVIGLSDHCKDNYPCFGAVALGACVIERHFTDSYDRPGPDIECSMDPQALSEMITGANQIFEARGGTKGALAEEKVTMDFAFATVVATADIRAGETITKEHIWVKRPGTGEFSAEDYFELLGKVAVNDVAKGKHLQKADVKL